MALYYRGELRLAREFLESALAAQTILENELHLLRYRLDQRSVTGTILAKALWLGGFPDRAWNMAQEILARAEESDHALTVLDALAYSSCHLAIFNGDLDAAGQTIAELSSKAVLDPQGPWSIFAQAWSGTLLSRQGDFPAAARTLAAALREVPEGSFLLPHTWFCGELAFALAKAGEIARANRVIDRAIDICKQQAEHWCLSELFRIKAEIVLLAGGAGATAAADAVLQQALTLAQQQGALSWELRAATSLARLKIADGFGAHARATLEPVMLRFSEGFDTQDFKEAVVLTKGAW